MERYDYETEVRNDVDEYLKENCEGFIDERRRDELYDEMFADDSVTGNASGSYTFNTWQAEENLCHNLSLLKAALSEFGGEMSDSAEANDVTIRCWMLGQVLGDAVDDWNEEHPEDEEDDEDGEQA